MNADPSYLQFISTVMSEDAEGTFELPPLGRRRFSISSYSSDNGNAPDMDAPLLEGRKYCTRGVFTASVLTLSATRNIVLASHAARQARERSLSWGDAAFEEILQSVGRSRTLSDVSYESDLSFRPPMPAPADPRASSPVVADPLPPPGIGKLPGAAAPPPIQDQYIPQTQLFIHNNGMGIYDNSMGRLPVKAEGLQLGAYSRQERDERIAKYRAKRARRVWRKQVKYDCRKKLADTRPRIKGRFVTKVGVKSADEEAAPEEFAPGTAGAEAQGSLRCGPGDTSCESFM